MKKCKNGKVKYRAEKEANRARMYILSHDPSANMLDLLPYVCPLCGFFHVGHRSKYILSTRRALAEKESASGRPPSLAAE
jgi:hypothetical protein